MEPERPIRIKPTAPPLSRGQPTKARPSDERNRRFRSLLVILVAGLAVAFVFLVIPEVARERNEDIRAVREAELGTVVMEVEGPQKLAPYANLEREKAREEATSELGSFVQLQALLEEEMNIDAWGAREYEQIKDLATVADQYFVENEYPRAMEAYRTATLELQELINEGSAQYDKSIAAGQIALDERDEVAATIAFQQALTIIPDDPIASNGRARAALLPRVSALLREFDRSLLRNDLIQARSTLDELQNLDPNTNGLSDAIVKLDDLETDDRYNGFVSEAFAALRNKQFDSATLSFNQALQLKPHDPVASDGLNQTKQNRLLTRLDELRSAAEHATNEGRWTDAIAAYDQALLLDRSVRYARDGREELRTLIAIIESMDKYLNDPNVLSSEDDFAQATKFLSAAIEQIHRGPAFDAKRRAFQALVERAGKPLPLVLLSDNVTEVSIYRIGKLGTFDYHELFLRPGRYTLLGSSDGCRDVRMTIVVEASMGPVSISCQERI